MQDQEIELISQNRKYGEPIGRDHVHQQGQFPVTRGSHLSILQKISDSLPFATAHEATTCPRAAPALGQPLSFVRQDMPVLHGALQLPGVYVGFAVTCELQAIYSFLPNDSTGCPAVAQPLSSRESAGMAGASYLTLRIRNRIPG